MIPSTQSPFNRKPAGAWVVVLIGLLSHQASLASSGSNWSEQPSWNADSQSSHRSTRNRDLTSNNDLAPFSPGSHNLAIDLGQVFLMGGLSKFSDNIGSQLHYTYGVSDIFSFDSSAGYSEHSDGKYSMGTLLGGMRVNLSWYDKIVPYAVFGLGFYKPSYRDESKSPTLGVNTAASGSSSVSAMLFGVHLGPGIDLQLSRNFFFGAALTFHNMFGTTKKFADATPLDLGGAYTSFFLHTGVTF